MRLWTVICAVVLTAPGICDPAAEGEVGQVPALAAEAEQSGEQAPPQAPQRKRRVLWGGDADRYFTGAFVGFLGHEAGHLAAHTALGNSVELKAVEFAFIPFFTIEPRRTLGRQEHYFTASAGFQSQFLINEWLLDEHPDLRSRDDPFLKGLAHFNFWLGVGYSASALAHYGPDERDTRGMANALGCSETAVAGLILAPTLLDAYRYRHPECEWAREASRGLKLLIPLLALTIED